MVKNKINNLKLFILSIAISTGIGTFVYTLINGLSSFNIWNMIILGILSIILHLVIFFVNPLHKIFMKSKLMSIIFMSYYLIGFTFGLLAFSLGGFNGIPVWLQILFIPIYALIYPIM